MKESWKEKAKAKRLSLLSAIMVDLVFVRRKIVREKLKEPEIDPERFGVAERSLRQPLLAGNRNPKLSKKKRKRNFQKQVNTLQNCVLMEARKAGRKQQSSKAAKQQS